MAVRPLSSFCWRGGRGVRLCDVTNKLQILQVSMHSMHGLKTLLLGYHLRRILRSVDVRPNKKLSAPQGFDYWTIELPNYRTKDGYHPRHGLRSAGFPFKRMNMPSRF